MNQSRISDAKLCWPPIDYFSHISGKEGDSIHFHSYIQLIHVRESCIMKEKERGGLFILSRCVKTTWNQLGVNRIVNYPGVTTVCEAFQSKWEVWLSSQQV